LRTGEPIEDEEKISRDAGDAQDKDWVREEKRSKVIGSREEGRLILPPCDLLPTIYYLLPS
jgi:hypothetical protein